MLDDETTQGPTTESEGESRSEAPARNAAKAAPKRKNPAKSPAKKAAAPQPETTTTEKLKVSDLAKELGRKSKDLLTRLEEMGEAVKSAQSKLSAELVDRLRAELNLSGDTDEATLADDVAGDTPSRSPFSAPTLAAPAAVAPAAPLPPVVLFQAPSEAPAPRRRPAKKAAAPVGEAAEAETELGAIAEASEVDEEFDGEGAGDEATAARRRRRRGRRGRGGAQNNANEEAESDESEDAPAEEVDEDAEGEDHADLVAEAALSASARRRRRRRRSGTGGEGGADDDPANTVVHVREARSPEKQAKGSDADDDGVRGVKGSTRLEAKRQRRRDNRDTGRRRAPILTEAEFLARRESVERVMAVRQTGDRTQIAVLEDDILVEHYVTRASAQSAVGNVYLGRVQNVLPSMEAAFIDIGRGRNGVLYAGEVNWDAAGLEGKARSIEGAMSSGDTVLVQVTKDPIGHKGARLTSQVSLPGRFVVYVPGGGMTGISRKLPDTERTRLKSILKKVVPDDAGVIVRTAAEGASEADLISDVERLKAQWEAIQTKAAKPSNAPTLVYGEPDLAIRVVRDVFNDDFKKLVVAGKDSYTTISDYVSDVAPDLADRISLYTGQGDLFHDLRVDEQLAKALDRKVWLPSGGSLVIDRTEAMTVIDVNTGKYTGSGGNLEQTVTRNNLEAAEEIVRQLRLRDIGGIVVIDFIDMVLESNRDLVLRRLTECLGRDRTKHQVAEVTSLGLVQMTRKRVGEGLLEAFSEHCSACNGRGIIVHSEPVDKKSGNGSGEQAEGNEDKAGGRNNRNRNRNQKQKAATAEVAVDAALDPAEEERRRAAANAIALIAAASHHHDEDHPDSEHGHERHPDAHHRDAHHHDAHHHEGEFDSALKEVEAHSEADDERTAADAQAAADDESASFAFGDAVVDAIGGTVSVETAAPLTAPAAVQTAAAQTAAPATSGGGSRPRRRRGASRPAGPPVGVAAGDSTGGSGPE